MGDQIAFPADWQRELKLGDQAYLEKDYLKAKKHYQKSCQLQPDYQTELKLLAVFEKLGDFQGGIEEIATSSFDYAKDFSGLSQLVRLYLLDQQYLAARQLLQATEKKELFPKVQLQSLWEDLQLLEKNQLFYQPELITQRKEYLARVNATKQTLTSPQWEQYFQGLTYQGFISNAKTILADAKNPFLRPRLVEELVKLGFQETIPIKDLVEKTQLINFQSLSLPQEDSTLKKMVESLKKYEQIDPVIASEIAQELKVHFALSYPFNPQKEDTLGWVKSYWLEYQVLLGQKTEEVLQDFLEIQEIKQLLRQLQFYLN